MVFTVLFFSLQNAVCFIILNCLVPVLCTFYIQGVVKLKKNNSCAKRLNKAIPLASGDLHETATYGCEDTRGCVMQFWPPDNEHMCSNHVQAWNTKINIRRTCCALGLLVDSNGFWERNIRGKRVGAVSSFKCNKHTTPFRDPDTPSKKSESDMEVLLPVSQQFHFASRCHSLYDMP